MCIRRWLYSADGTDADALEKAGESDEDNEEDELKFVVDVKNASDAPLCTMQCIIERLKEGRYMSCTNALLSWILTAMDF